MLGLALGLFSGTRKLLLKAWEFFTDDPWRLFVIVAAVFAFLWHSADNRAERLAKEIQALRDASAAVVEAGKAADAEARDVAEQTKGKVEDGNERARAAADGSDDPLRDGLDSLRRETGSSGSSAR